MITAFRPEREAVILGTMYGEDVRMRPDYGFDDGLKVEVIRYGEDSVSSKAISWDKNELLGLPSFGDDTERDQEVARQLQESRTVRRLGGIAVETAAAGNSNSEDVHLLYYGWGSNSKNPFIVNSIKAMVANNPDSQFVLTSPPSVGGSSRLTPSLEKEARRGNYAPYGELVAAAAQELTDGRVVYVGGHSLGSRVATAAVPYINGGAGVETLTLNDPPGATQSRIAVMGASLLTGESLHLRNYTRQHLDPSVPAVSIRSIIDATKGLRGHQLFVEPFALSRQTLESELALAVEHVRHRTRVLLPDMSALNDWRATASIVGQVSKESGSAALLEAWIVKRHTHSWLLGAKGVEAMIYNDSGDV